MRELPRPFLKWAGGKARLLPALSSRLPGEFGTYYEPFLGGGALFFHLVARRGPQAAVLSDINSDLVDTYLGVRDEVDHVVDCLREHADRHRRDYYYKMRGEEMEGQGLAPRAARIIYLNRTCYNGLYRQSRSGRFNVPMGRYRNPTICDEPLLRAASAALAAVELICAPFHKVARRAVAGDLVYMDPPYIPVSVTASFTSYHREGFNEEDQCQLARLFKELAAARVHVLLSNSDTEMVHEIYAGLPCDEVKVARSINSRASRRGGVGELIFRGGPLFS
ncbi:MAG: DNA adenine methylase [Acidobacteria bacterium]|nr:DNA adenine methylase [Acidobacteriota bacterium]MCZ6747405.1 DNA adenine methylase [Acidobacteriota bacterium]